MYETKTLLKTRHEICGALRRDVICVENWINWWSL